MAQRPYGTTVVEVVVVEVDKSGGLALLQPPPVALALVVAVT